MTIKKTISLLLSVCFILIPCFAMTAMHGHASAFTIQTPSNYVCYPADENGEAAPIPYTCTGSGTVVQSATTFTSMTAILSRPVIGSHRVAIIAEDFTTGNNVGTSNCVITAGQAACSVAISSYGSVSAGDVLAVKIWDDLGSPDSYNIEKMTWVLQ